MYKLNNNSAATMPVAYTLYTVTTIFDRAGRPTSCKLETSVTTINPLCVMDYEEALSNGRTRQTCRFFTMRDALDHVECVTDISDAMQNAPHFLTEQAALNAGKAHNETCA